LLGVSLFSAVIRSCVTVVNSTVINKTGCN